MKVSLTLPDNIAEIYQSYAQALRRPLPDILAAQLSLFVTANPKERSLLVGPESRRELEILFAGVPISSVQMLLEKVRGLASVSFGPIRVDMSSAQMKELEKRAKRNNRSVVQEVHAIYRALAGQFFDAV